MVADAFSISSWCLTLGLASSMKFQKSKKQKLNYSPVVEGRSAREGVPKRISNTPPLLKIKIMVSGPPKGIKESGSSPDPATGWVTCCWSVPRKSETVQTEVRTVPGHPGPTGRAKEHCRGSMRIQPDACWGLPWSPHHDSTWYKPWAAIFTTWRSVCFPFMFLRNPG